MAGKRKVTPTQVKWAKRRYRPGDPARSYSAIARVLQISRVHARDIVLGNKRVQP